MATRLYFASSGLPAVSPAITADWDAHVNVARRPLNATNGGSAMATVTYTPDAADHLVAGRAHVVQFVSDVLPPQVIPAQTVKLQVRAAEANAGNNLFLAWKVFAISSDGGTVLGTLVAVRADGTEAATALTSRSDSATSAEFIGAEPFRLVVELGFSGTPTASSGVQGHNGSMSFGEDGAADLPEDDIATGALNPWVQFSQNLTFRIGSSYAGFAFDGVCSGGDHVTLDISFNGGQPRSVVYTVDQIREPLSALSDDEKEAIALVLLKLHFAGKTRAEAQAELSGPGGVMLVI